MRKPPVGLIPGDTGPVRETERGDEATSLIDRRTALAGLLGLAWATRALAQSAATPSATPAAAAAPSQLGPGRTWPTVIPAGSATLTVYLPQLDAWDGHRLEARAAVSVTTSAQATPVFGVAAFVAQTQVDKGARQVTLETLRITQTRFPSAGSQEPALLKLVEQYFPAGARTIELDRLEAALTSGQARARWKTVPLRNDPPQIVFATTPTILILIDGPPAYRPVSATNYARVINTRPLVLRDSGGTHYLRLFDGWMSAPALTGPWSVPVSVPYDLDPVKGWILQSAAVDLLTGADPMEPSSAPSLTDGPAPAILVVLTPAELIVTQGEPTYVPVAGTQLLYASNTTGNVFKDATDQQLYVLVSGRWFRGPSTAGPWTYVTGQALPPDFAKIPDDSPKENVKASIRGTAEAQEALIANSIPQTATITRSAVKRTSPKYDGAPQWKPIDGTPLTYAVNCSVPVIRVSPTSHYALENGVWFVAASPQGPWTVADSVPPVVYSIPPSSPLHYVTYVTIFDATSTTVSVGYTPGYYGAYASEGTVVYGTGYEYAPWVGTMWYGAPVTYGFGVAETFTPWTGWIPGFGFGLAWGATTTGWAWGAYPWWGPYRGGVAGPRGVAAWGPGRWAATTGNVYRRWGDAAVVTRHSAGYNAWTGTRWADAAGMSYNSRTGALAAGQRASVGNVYTGTYAYGARGVAVDPRTGQAVAGGRVAVGTAGAGPQGSAGWIRGPSGGVARVGDDVYATHDGNVYRHTDAGWQERAGGDWAALSDPARIDALGQQQDMRWAGQERLDQFQASRDQLGGLGAFSGGGARGFGGGFRRR